MTKTAKPLAAALSVTLFAGAATAGALEDKIAAVNATLPGQWAGQAELETLATGELSHAPVAISYALFSEDRLSYAYWSENGLSLAHYLGAGRYRIDRWRWQGPADPIEYQVLDVDPPDENGDWTVHEMIFWPQDDGGVIAWPQTWSATAGALSVTRETAEPGVFPPAETWWRGYRIVRN